jgi:TolC family type I secretion outer membrane protein
MSRLVLMAGLAGAFLLDAPAAGATKLEDSLVLTYLNNPTLQSARADVRATDERVPQALSGWRPTVRINSEIGVEHSNNSLIAKPQDTEPRRVELELIQPLFRGGRTVAGTREAENTVRAQRARLEAVEQNVLLNAVQVFVDVTRDQSVVDLTRNNEQVLMRQLDASEDRFEFGEVTKTDVAQSQSRLARSTAQRIEAEGNLITSRASYKEVVGEYPEDLEPAMLPGDLPSSEEETIALSQMNPAVVSVEYLELAARDRVDVVFGELLPTLSLNGSLSREEDTSREGSEAESASLIALLTVPLYQAGGVDSRVREAKERVAQRRQDVEEQRRAVEQFATSAWRDLETARAQIQSFKAEVEATRIALEGTEQEALVGSRTVLDILDAEQEYLNAQVSLVRAQRDEIFAAYQVLLAVGRLTAREIALPVEYYDVEKHYRQVRNKFIGIGPDLE